MRICSKCQLRFHPGERGSCPVDGAPLVDAPDPRIGTVLGGRYLIEDVLGEGGMAIVYRARHVLVDRPFAIKVLRAEQVHDPAQRERIRREGRSAVALTHPNIVEIYDFGVTDDGAPYLVMELLQGKTLRQLMLGQPLALGDAVEIATQITQGLARAHDFGVVHRDLKPENVFVAQSEEGRPLVKLADFGIARSHQDSHLTSAGEIIGTPQYMAPERATSVDAEPPSDLYSLGVMLFEMTTGRLPFESNSPTGYVLKHIYEEPPRPTAFAPRCPPALEALILALLRKKPSERPVDAHRVLAELAALAPDTARLERTSRTSAVSPVHTARIDGWAARVAALEASVESAPEPRGPMRDALATLRNALDRLRAIHREGVNAQSALDALEREGREGSERLGHAVHVLGADLSRAREEQRRAGAESDERATTATRARDALRELLTHVGRMDRESPDRPSPELVVELRASADAAAAWQSADAAAHAARERLETAARQLGDLGFQIEELRKHLADLEQSVAERGRESRAIVERTTRERVADEKEMLALVDRLGHALPAQSAPAPPEHPSW